MSLAVGVLTCSRCGSLLEVVKVDPIRGEEIYRCPQCGHMEY